MDNGNMTKALFFIEHPPPNFVWEQGSFGYRDPEGVIHGCLAYVAARLSGVPEREIWPLASEYDNGVIWADIEVVQQAASAWLGLEGPSDSDLFSPFATTNQFRQALGLVVHPMHWRRSYARRTISW